MATDEPALDWILVGGGIHGVHLAARLIVHAGVAPERLCLVDPAPRLLEAWRRCSANTGMRYLRSPAVHHLDVDPWSLLLFAGANKRGRGAAKGLFIPPYERPSTDLFVRHCDYVIDRYTLSERHIRDRATRIELGCDEVVVHLQASQSIRARRVILALGSGGRPHWPDWACVLRDEGRHVQHVFEEGFDLKPEDWPERVAVVGGGISAAQVALRLAQGDRQVHLVSRHDLRKHQFDSDPGWLGPKFMRRFTATKDRRKRREMIHQARNTGSLPPDVHRALRRAIDVGEIRHHRVDPRPSPGGEPIGLQLGDDSVEVDGVLLATGFAEGRPGGALVDDLVQTHALPCAACGYPVVDKYLRWHPSVFVTGPLAELEVGPISRNIAGARRAGERIVLAAKAS